VSDEDRQADALEAALSEEDRAFLDRVADALVRRRLTSPALFFLESMKPLNLVASSAMIVFRPLVVLALREPGAYDRISRLLEQRGTVELLLRRLEARA